MCAVIIGAGTSIVTTLFPQGGVTSVNFGFRPEINRLWELGSWTPYDTYVVRQQELSLTGYGRTLSGQKGSISLDLTPSTACTDASSVSIAVTPGACGAYVEPFVDDFFPTSYSYSKDVFGFGTENWSFTTKQDIDNYTGTIVMLRGISTGQISTGDGIMSAADMGVVIDDAASKDSNGDYIDGESGSVQAGFPGIGDYSIQREVVVTHVGQSEGRVDGYKGNASVTIPMQPVYL